jgi:hypothetical protein
VDLRRERGLSGRGPTGPRHIHAHPASEEGIAAVDDVARVAVAYCSAYDLTETLGSSVDHQATRDTEEESQLTA